MEEPTPSGRSRPQRRKGLRSSSTKALWFSFTGLLLLMTVIAVDALQFARNLEATSSDLRSGVRRRDGLLDQLRSDIYRSSTVMRDHLLEDDDALAEGQKVELDRAEAAQDNATREERIASVRRTAERSIGMIRNIALMLRPSMLDDLGLVAALQWQAREITRRHGLKVKMLTGELAGELPDEYRTCLYRVVQEALNNCAKHAKASQVRVVVHQETDGIVVTVQDDGVGFSPDREKGLGLLGMTERIARVGGSFSIDSQPRRGTVLSAHLPLTGDAAADV